MKSYAVTLPVCGSITVFVHAENKEEALNKAFEEQDWRIEGGPSTEPGDFESVRHIVKGNVCYCDAYINDYSVEEEGEL